MRAVLAAKEKGFVAGESETLGFFPRAPESNKILRENFRGPDWLNIEEPKHIYNSREYWENGGLFNWLDKYTEKDSNKLSDRATIRLLEWLIVRESSKKSETDPLIQEIKDADSVVKVKDALKKLQPYCVETEAEVKDFKAREVEYIRQKEIYEAQKEEWEARNKKHKLKHQALIEAHSKIQPIIVRREGCSDEDLIDIAKVMTEHKAGGDGARKELSSVAMILPAIAFQEPTELVGMQYTSAERVENPYPIEFVTFGYPRFYQYFNRIKLGKIKEEDAKKEMQELTQYTTENAIMAVAESAKRQGQKVPYFQVLPGAFLVNKDRVIATAGEEGEFNKWVLNMIFKTVDEIKKDTVFDSIISENISQVVLNDAIDLVSDFDSIDTHDVEVGSLDLQKKAKWEWENNNITMPLCVARGPEHRLGNGSKSNGANSAIEEYFDRISEGSMSDSIRDITTDKANGKVLSDADIAVNFSEKAKIVNFDRAVAEMMPDRIAPSVPSAPEGDVLVDEALAEADNVDWLMDVLLYGDEDRARKMRQEESDRLFSAEIDREELGGMKRGGRRPTRFEQVIKDDSSKEITKPELFEYVAQALYGDSAKGIKQGLWTIIEPYFKQIDTSQKIIITEEIKSGVAKFFKSAKVLESKDVVQAIVDQMQGKEDKEKMAVEENFKSLVEAIKAQKVQENKMDMIGDDVASSSSWVARTAAARSDDRVLVQDYTPEMIKRFVELCDLCGVGSADPAKAVDPKEISALYLGKIDAILGDERNTKALYRMTKVLESLTDAKKCTIDVVQQKLIDIKMEAVGARINSLVFDKIHQSSCEKNGHADRNEKIYAKLSDDLTIGVGANTKKAYVRCRDVDNRHMQLQFNGAGRLIIWTRDSTERAMSNSVAAEKLSKLAEVAGITEIEAVGNIIEILAKVKAACPEKTGPRVVG